MTYTKFGEFMRVLRVRHHEVMGDVAKLLGVSTPFLSAVENGRKNVPNEWFDIIAEHYALSDDEIADMKNAAENSRNQVKITLSKSETIREMWRCSLHVHSMESMRIQLKKYWHY